MQPIHLAIGLMEGVATAGLVSFIWNARPEILDQSINGQSLGNISVKNILISLFVLALLTGGILTWYTSKHPDGLEWSIEKVTGRPELEIQDQSMHNKLDEIQSRTSLMPDYDFKKISPESASEKPFNSSKAGSSLAGLLGGMIVLIFSIFIGIILKKRNYPA